jgi:hypothetical protein
MAKKKKLSGPTETTLFPTDYVPDRPRAQVVICLNAQSESYMCPVCLSLFSLDDADCLGARQNHVFCPDCSEELRL